jgi:hypothetical protein
MNLLPEKNMEYLHEKGDEITQFDGTIFPRILSMRGSELSLYSVCAELSLAYTENKLNSLEKWSIFELIPSMRGNDFSLYSVCVQLSLAHSEYAGNYILFILSVR